MININACNKALVEESVHYNSQNILIEHSLWNNRKEKCNQWITMKSVKMMDKLILII